MGQKEMTPVELARKRGVTIDWIYRELRLGKIPAVRRGRRWLIPADQVSGRRGVAFDAKG
jgi:excisionase family DNA binding protein